MFKIGDKVVRKARDPWGVSKRLDVQPYGRIYEVVDVKDGFLKLKDMFSPEGELEQFSVERFNVAPGNEVAIMKPMAPQAPKKAPKRAQERSKFVPRGVVRVESNKELRPFYPAREFHALVGQEVVIGRIENVGDYIRLFPKAEGGCFLDSRQCTPILRKDGKPRIARKKAAPKPPKEKGIKNILPFLNEQCKGRVSNSTDTCYYGHLFEDGTKSIQVPDVCHARVAQYGRKVKQLGLCLIPHMNEARNAGNEVVYVKYVDYILNRSPFKHCFIHTKNPIENGVLVNLDNTLSHIMAACIALREGSEWQLKLRVYGELIEAGYSEDVSWFVSRQFQNLEGKYSLSLSRYHTVTSSSMGVKEVLKVFKDGLYKDPYEKKYNEALGRSFRVFQAMCGSAMEVHRIENDQIGSVFHAKAKPLIVGEGFNRKSEITFDSIKLVADYVKKELS